MTIRSGPSPVLAISSVLAFPILIFQRLAFELTLLWFQTFCGIWYFFSFARYSSSPRHYRSFVSIKNGLLAHTTANQLAVSHAHKWHS